MFRSGLALLARLTARRPRLVVVLGLLFSAAAGGYAALALEVKTRRGELVDPDIPFQRRYIELEEEHGDLDVIIAAIKGRDRAETLRYAAALADRIAPRQRAFRSVFYKIDPAAFGEQALLFAELSDLEALAGFIRRALPSLNQGALPAALRALAAEVDARAEQQTEGAASPALGARLERFLEELTRASQGLSAAPTALDQDTAGQGAVWATDGETLVMLVAPQIDAVDLDPRRAAVMTMRAEIAALAATFPEVEVGLTGKPVLNVDEIETYTADSIKATIIALIAVTALVMLALRRLIAPLIIGLCLALTIVATLGAAAVWPGHLNLLSVVFVVVIIGLGVDFGLHLIARYDEEIMAGGAPEAALERAMVRTGSATAAGALTTAVAFLSTAFTDFRGLQELGVIAGSGVLIALVIMLTVMPALVLLADARRGAARARRPSVIARATDAANRRFAWPITALCLLAAAAALALYPRVSFNGNLLELQDPSLASVQLELRLLRDQRLSGWFLCVTSHDEQRLRDLTPRLEALPGVRRVEGLNTILPRQQPQKVALLRRLSADIRGALGDAPPQRLEAAALRAALQALRGALERAQELAFEGGRDEAVAALDELLRSIDAIAARLDGPLPAELVAYDAAFAARARALLEDLARLGAAARPVAAEDLPPVLKERFIGRSGARLLRIYPRADIWDSAASAAFIDEVRGVAPDATGVPLLIQESSRLMVEAYRDAALYSLAVIALFLLVYFRRPLPALLALVSLAVGAAWVVVLMALFGLALNPANLIALPLLLGIGIDYSVHVLHRFGEDRGSVASTSVGRAVIYSALTSAAGFGSLGVARHQGTASIGWLIALGLLCCLLAALSFLPAALNILGRSGDPPAQA